LYCYTPGGVVRGRVQLNVPALEGHEVGLYKLKSVYP
jgi:hypothetical protein